MFDAGAEGVDRDAKIELLTVLTADVWVAEQRGPLMVALERVTASLVRCYARQDKKLQLPRLCN